MTRRKRAGGAPSSSAARTAAASTPTVIFSLSAISRSIVAAAGERASANFSFRAATNADAGGNGLRARASWTNGFAAAAGSSATTISSFSTSSSLPADRA